MISGTSNIWLKSGPGDLLTITKMLQKIQENYGIILETYYLCQSGTQKIRKILNPGPTKHLFFLKVFCPPAPQKKIGIYDRF